MMACKLNRSDMVELLYEYNIDVDITDNKGLKASDYTNSNSIKLYIETTQTNPCVLIK
jgi:hypothetical protein